MKKGTKKFITGLVIFLSTLAIGFSVTLVSFNLFDSLTDTQLKLLFALDFISICLVASGAWFIYESKKAKDRKRKRLEERRSERAKQLELDNDKINLIIYQSNFAA